jgi:hypothetical protein
MASTAFLNQAYLAYFGRPVDTSGAIAYANATEAKVMADFSASPESIALYGSTFNLTQVNGIYQTLFGRDAELVGATYWLAEVAAGRQTPASAAVAILNGALGNDAVIVANKLSASAAFTTNLDTTAEALGYSGLAAAASARAFLNTVALTAATPAAVTAAVAVTVNAGAPVGSTFALTLNTDSTPATNYTAGLIFNPGNGVMLQSLQTGDVLTGTGAGSLTATLNGTALAPTISAVATQAYNTLAATALDAAGITGLTTLNTAGSAVLTVTNLSQTTKAFGISGSGSAGLSAAYAGADVATNAATLTLTGGTPATATFTTAAGPDVDQLTIVSSGTTANSLLVAQAYNDVSTESITISGTAALTLLGTAAQLGSLNNAKITATNTGGTTVRFTDVVATTVDVVGYTGVDGYAYDATGNAIIVTNINGASSTHTLRGADVTSATFSASTAGHVLNVVDGNATAADAYIVALGNANISTVNLTDAAGQTGTITLGNFSAIGTQTFNLIGPTTGTAGNHTVTLTNAALGTIAFNAGTYAGNLVIGVTNAAGPGVIITGGAGNDTIVGTALADVLKGGAGNDTISAGTTVLGDSVSGGLGADQITLTHDLATAVTSTVNATAAESFATATQFDTVIFSDNTAGAGGGTNTVTLVTGLASTVVTGATSVTIGTTAVTAGSFLAVGSASATLTTTNQNFQIYQDSNSNGIIDATDLRIDFNDGNANDTMAVAIVGTQLVITTTGVA